MELYSKKISEIYWYPINFDITGDKLNAVGHPIIFENGFKTNIYEFLKESKDVKMNKKSGMFLTDFLNSKYIFTDKNEPTNITKLTKIESPLKSTSSFIVTVSSYQNKTILTQTPDTNYSYIDTLKFWFNDVDDYVYIESNNGKCVTYDIASNTIFLSTKISPPIDTQKFNYLLGEDNIVLFSYGSNFSKIVTIDTSNKNILKLTDISYTLNVTLPTNSILKFTSFKKQDLIYDNVKNSYFTKYISNPLLSQKNLIPSQESLSAKYLQNYLAIFPYENPTFNNENESVSYKLQIHGLKNYQTPEYNYSQGIEYIQNFPLIRRKYTGIFSGTNQYNGLENIHLGFSTNTYLREFATDRYTVFYFPPTTSRISVHNSGLSDDGAYSGELPYVSDRIYSKQINYEEITPGQPQPTSIQREDGTWVCTWLSGNQAGGKLWVDRYFNSAYFTVDTKLASTDLLYNEKLNPNVDFEVWDEPSTLIFEPGCQYMYFRSGQENSKTFLSYLSADFYNPLGSKILDLSNYSTLPLVDSTPYKNKCIVFNKDETNLNEDYITLDGKTHIVLPAKNALLEKNNLTISFWLNVNDWANINGQQIFGNYYDSGFGLINEASVTTPIFTILDKTKGRAYNLNYKLSHIDDIYLPNDLNNSNCMVQRLSDLTYWIIDVQNRKLRKYGIEGKITIEKDVSSKMSYIDQIETDSKENIYLYDKQSKKVVKLDTLGNYISTSVLTEKYNRIEINLNDDLIYSYGESSCVDNNNNLWEVIGGNLYKSEFISGVSYKNRQIHANIGQIQQISCDIKNNIWMVHAKDGLTKFNIDENKFEFTKSIGKNSLVSSDCFSYGGQYRFLNFIRTPKTSVYCIDTNDKTEDLAILIDDSDKIVYLINSDGKLVSKLGLYGLITVNVSTVEENHTFKAIGDFSSYQHLRKFGALKKNLSWKFKMATANGKEGILNKLTYDVAEVPPGWHNFTFVFDSTNGFAKYYIDTILVDAVEFQKAKYQIQYDYKSSLLVGASNIKNTTLNDLIQIDDAYKLIGEIGQIVMYNKSLTQGEISQIYFASNLSIDKTSLNWNVPIGVRNYIEEIKHWFQMQLPTNKSKYYNINIHNLKSDDNVKKLIEDSIRSNVKKISPAHTDLYKINWLDSTREETGDVTFNNTCS